MATIEPYRTGSGATRYMVRYRRPDRGQTMKRGFRTKRDAQAFAATVEVAKMRGEYVAPSLGKVTVGELGPAWLERQRGHMKPSGFRSLRERVACPCRASVGATAIADLRFTDVQAWVAELSAKRGARDRCDRVLRAGAHPR